MSTNSLGGLWTYPSFTCPEHNDFMFIDEVRSRIINFAVFTCEPLRRCPIPNWYQLVSPTSLTAKVRATGAWRVHEFQLDGDRLSWTYGGGVHAWLRLPWDERPDWLDEKLATEYLKMDAAEKST